MFMWMCIVSKMVWCTSFFVWGQGTRRKTIHFVCTQNFCGGGLRWGGNVLTIMGFQSIMMAGELGGNTG
ncbi:hypothetical protein DW098_04925 [Ruminococcus sp. AM07-21]|nr:hypothetical protein DXD97_10295 [Ruminococcus sp. TM10-9AT]RHJ98606.1 hypothetical protein DW098_04925 [Ruminococcus sp. AM07-21]